MPDDSPETPKEKRASTLPVLNGNSELLKFVKKPSLSGLVSLLVTNSIMVLILILTGPPLDLIYVGPRLGGARRVEVQEQLAKHRASLDDRFDSFEMVISGLPSTTESYKVVANRLFEQLRTKDRQRYTRIFYLLSDVVDNACENGGVGWKKKHLKEVDRLLAAEDEPDPLGLRGTDKPPPAPPPPRAEVEIGDPERLTEDLK